MRTKVLPLMAFSLAVVLAVASVGTAQSKGDPTPAPRWLEVDYDLEITEDLDALTLSGDVGIHEVPSSAETSRACGTSCSADELREIYQTSSEQRKQALVDGLEERIAASTQAMLAAVSGDEDATATADVDETSLEAPVEGWEYVPEVPVDVTGQADIETFDDAGYSSEQIDALFRMGARVDVPINATVEAGTNLTLDLDVPEPLAVVDAGQEGTLVDAQTVRWTVTNWKGTSSTELQDEIVVGHPDVVIPEQEQIDLDIVLDLSEVDPHYFQALTGGTPATMTANLTVDGSIAAIETPTELEGVELAYLSADAIRIGLENDLIALEEITAFEDEARASIRQAFRSSFGEAVPVSGGFVPATLEASANGDPAGTGPPIRLDMGAEGELDLPPEQGQAPDGAAGFEVTRFDMGTFELPSIPTPGDRPATITMILPNGLDLAFEDADGAEVTRSTTEDGRTAITFTTQGSDQATSIQGAEIVVEHPFVWDMFWPVLLFLFLVLVVLPAAIIVFVVRRRRRQTRGVNQDRRSPVKGGYADEGQKTSSSSEES